jgi:hypothetical protein
MQTQRHLHFESFLLLYLCFLLPLSINGQIHRTSEQLFHPTKLSGKTITITLQYAHIACTCAQWLDANSDHGDDYFKYLIWLEPANEKLKDTEHKLWVSEHEPFYIKVIGQFYTEKGWPRQKFPKGHGEAARVFRFEKIEPVINNKK